MVKITHNHRSKCYVWNYYLKLCAHRLQSGVDLWVKCVEKLISLFTGNFTVPSFMAC